MSRAISAFLMILCIAAFSDRAQARLSKMYRIGFLTPSSSSSMQARIEPFRQGLRELGYIEGQNIAIEYRWGDGRDERLDRFASELISLQVDLLVTHGALATLAAKRASATIPIACFACGDLISTGLVANLARPGSNVTGLTVLAPEASGKRVELLKEVVPKLDRLAVLWNPDNPVSKPELKETEAAAKSAGLQLQSVNAAKPGDFGRAIGSMSTGRSEALIVLSDAMFFGNRAQISDLAIKNRLPAISWSGEFAKSGTLMGYGPNIYVLAKRAATYVDKILKGAKPSDLPIEQPTKFDLAINLKTAKALGLAVPATVIARADELIE